MLDGAARVFFVEPGSVASCGADTPVAAVERAVFWIGDWHLDQTDHYVVHRVASVDALAELDRTGWTPIEHDTVLGWRWWSTDELRATSERFWPADLPEILDRLHRRSV